MGEKGVGFRCSWMNRLMRECERGLVWVKEREREREREREGEINRERWG